MSGPTNVENFVAALVGPAQPLEDAIRAVIASRNINDEVNCVGVAIDALGKLVGRKRNGFADDVYRRHVRAQIATNKSDGMIEDVIAIADLVVFTDGAYYHVRNDGIAAMVLAIEGIAITDDLANTLLTFLRRAAAGGVRLILEWRTRPLSETFRYDTGPGYDVGHYATSRT